MASAPALGIAKAQRGAVQVAAAELAGAAGEIAGGIYKASLLEESVFIQEAGPGTVGSSNESDAVSVSDYSLRLPNFSSIFSNLL